MRYLTGSQVAATLDNLVHQDIQQHDYECDLTVSEIYRLTDPGALDFGGSEYALAGRKRLQPQPASADDAYGWWDLTPGTYMVRFNEAVTLAEGQIAFVQPHERLLLAGAHHPTFYFRGQRETLESILIVGQAGLLVKENARLSKLLKEG